MCIRDSNLDVGGVEWVKGTVTKYDKERAKHMITFDDPNEAPLFVQVQKGGESAPRLGPYLTPSVARM